VLRKPLEQPKTKRFFDKLKQQAVLLKTISAGWEFVQVAKGKLEAFMY